MNKRISDSSKVKRSGHSTLISQFGVAVTEPEFGINLGYLARTSANFGMKDLLVVSQKQLEKDKIAQAELFSAHGRPLIKRMKYVNSMDSLKREYKILIGTTAIEARRKSNLTRTTLGLEECAKRVFQRLQNRRESVCFVFGRDTTGLTNEELRQCDYNLTIRTHSSYNTLNLSHAAAIIFYIFANYSPKIAKENSIPQRSGKGSPALSTRKERERAVALFLQLGQSADFKSFKRELLKESLERMFNRANPSLREIYLLMGLASKATGKINRLSSHASSERLSSE